MSGRNQKGHQDSPSLVALNDDDNDLAPVKKKHLEAFRRYIESEGVVEFLTQTLVMEYDERSEPSTALQVLKSRITMVDVEALKEENRELKEILNQLKKRRRELLRFIASLSQVKQ